MVARLVESNLKSDNENHVALASVEGFSDLMKLTESEMLVFGFPTYHGLPSKTMLNFIAKLPYYKAPLYCFAFTTCGLYSSNSLRVFAQHCRAKNLFLLHHNNKNCEHCFRCIHLCPTKALSLLNNNKQIRQLNDKFFVEKMKSLEEMN